MKKIVRRSGFTLPEVLVTVTVVAVLAAVVVPAVTQYVNRGNAPATETDISQLQNAVTGYAADTHAYPNLLTDLITAPAGVANWKGPYLSANVGTIASGTGVVGSYTTGVDLQGHSSAFTSSGLGVQFADSIYNSGGYLWLRVAYPTPCSSVNSLNTALPGTVFQGYLTGYTSAACTGASSLIAATDTVTVRIATIGTGS